MIIKSFTGPTVAAVLKLVRDEMGGDAVVLKTRVLPIDETKVVTERVEVTACIDESILSPVQLDYMLKKDEKRSNNISKNSGKAGTLDVVAETPENLQNEPDKKPDTVLSGHGKTESPEKISSDVKPVYCDLLDADIPVEITRQLIENIEKQYSSDTNIKEIACEVLSDYLNRFMVSDIQFRSGMKIIFTGFSGAGKTSALAKLAAQLVTGLGLKVTLSSLDDMKVAAYEEMGSYADILNLPSAMFDELAERQKNDSLVLIDTPPLPIDPTRRQELLDKINNLKPDMTFLVFSACNRTCDLIDAVNIFKSVSPDYLIAAHLDETKRWGTIYSMTGSLKTPLVFTTNSPGGIGELSRADASEVARTVLKMEASNEIE